MLSFQCVLVGPMFWDAVGRRKVFLFCIVKVLVCRSRESSSNRPMTLTKKYTLLNQVLATLHV